MRTTWLQRRTPPSRMAIKNTIIFGSSEPSDTNGKTEKDSNQKHLMWIQQGREKSSAYQEEQLQKKYEKEHTAEKAQLKTFGEYAEEYTYGVLPASSYAHGTKIRYEESYRVHIKKTWIANMPIRKLIIINTELLKAGSRQTLYPSSGCQVFPMDSTK